VARQVVGKGAFGKVFLVKKRDGDKAEQLFAMKVLDKEVITQKGQVAHTKVITQSSSAHPQGG
jgi:serine/threonine protein kinase